MGGSSILLQADQGAGEEILSHRAGGSGIGGSSEILWILPMWQTVYCLH